MGSNGLPVAVTASPFYRHRPHTLVPGEIIRLFTSRAPLINLYCHEAPVRFGSMRDLLVLLVHFLATLTGLLGPGATPAVIAETLLAFHKALKNCELRRLFSSQHGGKPDPKGPSEKLVQAILKMKRRRPRSGCLRIAQ